MDTFSRNKEIRDLSKIVKKADLAKKYNLSESRIGQICSKVERKCEIHNALFYTSCRACTADAKKKLNVLKENPKLFKEYSEVVKSEGRTKEVVEKTKKLIKTLHEEFELPTTSIGALLGKTHSTVLHHLKN